MSSILKDLSNLPRVIKGGFLLIVDIVVICFSMLLSLAVRFEPSSLEARFLSLSEGIYVLIGVQLLGLSISGLYRSVLRHAGSELLVMLLRSVLLGAGLFALMDLMLFEYVVQSGYNRMPRSIIVMSATFAFLGLLSIRLMIRWVIRIHIVDSKEDFKHQRIAIYGAGSAGLQLYDSLSQEGKYQITTFVDDNPNLQGGRIREKPILSFKGLQNLHSNNPLDSVLVALPGVKHNQRKLILQKLRPLKIGVRVLPTIDQLVRGVSNASQLQEIDITDLLGRDEISPDKELLNQEISGRNILVTGAGGTIGSELCREILSNSPNILILLELNEFALYQVEDKLKSLYSVPIVARLGSVHNRALVNDLLSDYKIQTVFHTAAYKHVPLVEENKIEGLRNNVLGTKILLETCLDAKINSFVLISTDKAVRPTNVMGASKRVAEMIVQDMARKNPESKLGIVRFGNVLDSSGSVVRRFREQINNRKTITVTHPEITRFFMSVGEAARLVIQAGAMSMKGEVFLLDMGEPVKINDLAIQMIELSGLIPEKDIPIRYSGLRPGEKLFEELLIDPTKSKPTKHPRIFFSEEPLPEADLVEKEIDLLTEALSKQDLTNALNSLRRIVPEYNPNISY